MTSRDETAEALDARNRKHSMFVKTSDLTTGFHVAQAVQKSRIRHFPALVFSGRDAVRL